MQLVTVRENVLNIKADAIVVPVDTGCRPVGRAAEAVFEKAGPRLRRALDRKGQLPTGEVRATKGYGTDAKYLIHAAAPVWGFMDVAADDMLRACYADALGLAESLGCRSVAVTMLSTGACCCPEPVSRGIAERIARGFLESRVQKELEQGEGMKITLVVEHEAALPFDYFGVRDYLERHLDEGRKEQQYRPHNAFAVIRDDWPVPELFTSPDSFAGSSASYSDAAPIEESAEAELLYHADDAAQPPAASRPKPASRPKYERREADHAQSAPNGVKPYRRRPGVKDFPGAGQLSTEEREIYDSINRMLDSDLDQSFNQLLLSMIDEAGIDDVACYKRANIDRRLFSKIRSDPSYHPRKSTVLAFAIALKLEVRRISTLLMKAGYALSDADPRDLIIVFFAKQGNYDIDRINSALLAFDLEPLC
ncbi:MAG: macro domain-containing protein [Clostridia bacterium]|nr:macro domain-containing protein [Clostridia bacterium]